MAAGDTDKIRNTTARFLVTASGNGIEEVPAKGRYIMRDKRGRTIVNRQATSEDRSRLRSLRN